MHLYVKHASLINSCYPEKEGEKGPRSSELSYLTFYASSRPVKLTKVGLFLEKKVERDIQKGRRQNNQVSLDIIKALVHACNRDLNLFSKYIVRILNMILDTKDIALVDLACETFIIFAEYHEGSTLGVDAEFTVDYELLVMKFAAYCDSKGPDDLVRLQMRYIGQRGIHAAVTSSALYASDFKTQVDVIMPPLITALANSAGLEMSSTNESVDIHVSAVNNDTLDKATVDLLTISTCVVMLSKANGGAVRTTLRPVFTFMDTQGKWWPPKFATSLFELVLDSLQPQFRHLLVSDLLQELEISKTNRDDAIPQKFASIVSILDKLLNANVPLVGISVLEVLNMLYNNLFKSLQGRPFCDTPGDNEEKILEYTVHCGLVHGIGGLASQVYYQNQLNDMSGYIITKFRVGTALEHTDGLPIIECRRVALRCLDQILSGKKHAIGHEDEAQGYPTEISLEVWIPAFGLLTDPRTETRVDFIEALVRYLEATCEEDMTLGPFPKHMLHHHGDVMFINALHQIILDWVMVPNYGLNDAHALYIILCALTRRFGADGTIKSFPLMFKLQSLVEAQEIRQPLCGRAIAAVIIEWLAMLGQFYSMSRLCQYASEIKQARIGKVKEEAPGAQLNDLTPKEAIALESNNPKPLTHFADRYAVVEIISKDGPLRNEQDTHGLELESKLYAEWGSEAFLSHERAFRIRTSRNLEDLKPKLSNLWPTTDHSRIYSHETQSIKVETLKEALSQPSQHRSLENKESKAKSPTSSISASSASPAKPTKHNRKDVSSLLSTLSFGSNENLSSSLVNPPYKL
ncbi:hypothetical protein BDF14DRAFT_1954770 [Spinellus fusiger]|nr:hypothetical protein BDF14DRAFT_1954770 [Spinellus fusiger]